LAFAICRKENIRCIALPVTSVINQYSGLSTPDINRGSLTRIVFGRENNRVSELRGEMHKDRNIKWHKAKITKEERWMKNAHRSALIWITGLSASGKSTIATELEHRLFHDKVNTFVLDGDNVRHGLCKDLGFQAGDRKENLRRVGEVAKLLVDAGVLTIAAFISPYASDRNSVRALFNADDEEFIEVYLKCELAVCEERDPKGLYKKARQGEIPFFTGVSDPYETPESPEIIIETDRLAVGECVQQIIDHLKTRKII
jgi:adenylylsulfate kinase